MLEACIQSCLCDQTETRNSAHVIRLSLASTCLPSRASGRSWKQVCMLAWTYLSVQLPNWRWCCDSSPGFKSSATRCPRWKPRTWWCTSQQSHLCFRPDGLEPTGKIPLQPWLGTSGGWCLTSLWGNQTVRWRGKGLAQQQCTQMTQVKWQPSSRWCAGWEWQAKLNKPVRSQSPWPEAQKGRRPYKMVEPMVYLQTLWPSWRTHDPALQAILHHQPQCLHHRRHSRQDQEAFHRQCQHVQSRGNLQFCQRLCNWRMSLTTKLSCIALWPCQMWLQNLQRCTKQNPWEMVWRSRLPLWKASSRRLLRGTPRPARRLLRHPLRGRRWWNKATPPSTTMAARSRGKTKGRCSGCTSRALTGTTRRLVSRWYRTRRHGKERVSYSRGEKSVKKSLS